MNQGGIVVDDGDAERLWCKWKPRFVPSDGDYGGDAEGVAAAADRGDDDGGAENAGASEDPLSDSSCSVPCFLK